MSGRKPLLKVREAAALLRLSPSRVYALIAARLLPSVRIGGALRVPAAALDQWLQDQVVKALRSVKPSAQQVNGGAVPAEQQAVAKEAGDEAARA